MRYAITLNLDYSNYPASLMRRLFRKARAAFLQAGFVQDGRLFTTGLPAEQASILARQALEQAAAQCELGPAYPYVKEFYGFAFDDPVNLLLPPATEITVEELPGLVSEASA